MLLYTSMLQRKFNYGRSLRSTVFHPSSALRSTHFALLCFCMRSLMTDDVHACRRRTRHPHPHHCPSAWAVSHSQSVGRTHFRSSVRTSASYVRPCMHASSLLAVVDTASVDWHPPSQCRKKREGRKSAVDRHKLATGHEKTSPLTAHIRTG